MYMFLNLCLSYTGFIEMTMFIHHCVTNEFGINEKSSPSVEVVAFVVSTYSLNILTT